MNQQAGVGRGRLGDPGLSSLQRVVPAKFSLFFLSLPHRQTPPPSLSLLSQGFQAVFKVWSREVGLDPDRQDYRLDARKLPAAEVMGRLVVGGGRRCQKRIGPAQEVECVKEGVFV